mmetsp:Transcript_67245/g.161163  ORF Transcript_67245/g.161163 Transcript_67245/m.161163 type:complete len:237 (-) Transcript_67245:21-731(-)
MGPSTEHQRGMREQPPPDGVGKEAGSSEGAPSARQQEIEKTCSSKGSIRCPICQEEVEQRSCWQVRACQHSFCEDCIHKWAESCSLCPLCKSEMGGLVPLRGHLGKRVRGKSKVDRAVPARRLRIQPSSEEGLNVEDNVLCEVCGGGEEGDKLLLCDSCDRAHHTFCLTPPLLSVPGGDWYCPVCVPVPRPAGRPKGRSAYLGPGRAHAADDVREGLGEAEATPPRLLRRLRQMRS